MHPEPDNWVNRIFDKAEEILARLQRHCPRCGGALHRTFSVLDKIGLWFPLPHTIYARHECDQCHTKFRSYRTLTDLFLEVSWITGLLYLGQFRLLALACTITWLVIGTFTRSSVSCGENDTLGAGFLTGLLWLLALVFGNKTFGTFFFNHWIAAFPIMIGILFVPVWMVLVLDRYTNFGLKATEEREGISKAED